MPLAPARPAPGAGSPGPSPSNAAAGAKAGPRLAQLPPHGTAGKRIEAVRRLHGRRRRAAWRQRLVDAERGLVLGFRRDGVLAGHLFVVTLAVAAGAVLGLPATAWAVLAVALGTAMGAELFAQVLAAVAAAVAKGAGPGAAGPAGPTDRTEDLAAAVRLCGAAVAVTAAGACAALVAVFAPAVVRALG